MVGCLRTVEPLFQAETDPSGKHLPNLIQINLPLNSMEFYNWESQLTLSVCDGSVCNVCGDTVLAREFVGKPIPWRCSDVKKGHIVKIEAKFADSVYFCNLGIFGYFSTIQF